MSKVDFKKELKHLYRPSAKSPLLVDVPPMQYLMVDGHGDPNMAPEYAAAVEALYAVAYKIKFLSKKELERDYVVPPLEGLWWAEDMETFSTNLEKSAWDWTMMIMQPEWISHELFERAVREVGKKKDLPALPGLRLESYHEGPSAQVMHVGPYDAEGPTIAGLHTFIEEQGHELHGKHHEIYLSDPRRVAPAKMKTVIRQPVRKVQE